MYHLSLSFGYELMLRNTTEALLHACCCESLPDEEGLSSGGHGHSQRLLNPKVASLRPNGLERYSGAAGSGPRCSLPLCLPQTKLASVLIHTRPCNKPGGA